MGQYFKRLGINQRIDTKFTLSGKGIANSDILKSYLGLLVQGKSDFDAVEAFRGDAFFWRALGIGTVPSSPTLRQRMDTHSASWFDLAEELNVALLSAKYAGKSVDFGALPCGYMPLDWDTFVMDNSGTNKEDVGRTYQGVDGYTPSATYLGSLSYCLELALRPGVQHSARETGYNLERVLPMACRLTSSPLLMAHCTLDGWTTTLPVAAFDESAVIALYADHATHEQFHSEFKTDMDLSRLPSGKFDTNYLVCALAAIAMNILRLMGQNALPGKDAPVRHAAKRRRIKTVMQELIYKAGRMIKHAGRWVLGIGAQDSGFAVFDRLYGQLKAT